MKKIFLNGNKATVYNVFPEALRTEIFGDEKVDVFNKAYVLEHPESFADTEYIFSTWGMPWFSDEEVKQYFPSLKCIFYAAGTVQSFARPFLNNGVKVFSAWAANAVPVAEYTVAQIILANKGFYRCSIMSNKEEYHHSRNNIFSINLTMILLLSFNSMPKSKFIFFSFINRIKAAIKFIHTIFNIYSIIYNIYFSAKMFC